MGGQAGAAACLLQAVIRSLSDAPPSPALSRAHAELSRLLCLAALPAAGRWAEAEECASLAPVPDGVRSEWLRELRGAHAAPRRANSPRVVARSGDPPADGAPESPSAAVLATARASAVGLASPRAGGTSAAPGDSPVAAAAAAARVALALVARAAERSGMLSLLPAPTAAAVLGFAERGLARTSAGSPARRAATAALALCLVALLWLLWRARGPAIRGLASAVDLVTRVAGTLVVLPPPRSAAL